MNVKRAFVKNNLKHKLLVAKNGHEALSLLRGLEATQRPSLILLDLNMPKMGGLEFLAELRNDKDLKQLFVYVITTSDNEADKSKAFQYNVAGYIQKPIQNEHYLSMFSSLNAFWNLNTFI